MRSIRAVLPIVIIVSFMIGTRASGQTFVRITSGEIVTASGLTWGCAWGDYDQDGLPDLFVARDGTNALYRGHGDGTFTKITTGSLGTDGGSSRGATWGDYDNDGYPDLFVPNNFTNDFLYRNEGPAGGYVLTKITAGPIGAEASDARGSSWADMDNDGFLDLVIARNGNNFLYRNNGDGSFTQVDTGAVVADIHFSIGPTWCDFDNDGDADLFVASMSSEKSVLYINQGGGWFTKLTTGPPVTDGSNSAAGAWGDFDNDGDFDLFVANAPGTSFFYVNNGPPDYTFTKVTTGPVASEGGTSYGSSWADFDNDGDLDLFVAKAGSNAYFRNNGPPDYSFTKVTDLNIVTDGGTSWGSAVGDFNNDGAVDIFVANSLVDFLYRNEGNANSWLRVKCLGTVSNRSALGARVSAKATINGNPVWQTREITGQSSYYSQSAPDAHFGFGDATVVDSLVIRWPSGTMDVHLNVPTRWIPIVTEGGGITGLTEDRLGVPKDLSVSQNYPNPFNPSTSVSIAISVPARVVVKVHTVLGQEIRLLLDDVRQPGTYQTTWDGRNAAGEVMAGGVYFCRVSVVALNGGRVLVETRKMVMVK